MFYFNLTNGSGTLVKHLSYHPNIMGSSPVAATGDGREKIVLF
jgi:hypothetical protein